MNFCLQCGTALPQQMTINLQNDPPPTQVYRESAPTNPNENRGTFPNNANFAPNPGAQQPPRKKSKTKLFLILGGVFALFLLLVFAGLAIVAYNIMSTPKTVANNNTNYPTPYKTPVPLSSATPRTNLNSKPTANSNVYTAPTPATKSATDPNGKIDRTWVDYNVTENGRTGMRIHNKFWTYNLKDTECYLAVYFQKDDGTDLTSEDTNFRSAKGTLALFKLLKPNYGNTVYDDVTVFMPYGEIDVPTGKHNLKLDVDLITKGGDLIQHLNFHEFEYERFAE